MKSAYTTVAPNAGCLNPRLRDEQSRAQTTDLAGLGYVMYTHAITNVTRPGDETVTCALEHGVT